MKSRMIAGIASALLMVSPTVLLAAPGGQNSDPNTVAQQNMSVQPAMSQALQHLAEAKKSLEGGNSEHGGHRAKALEHVNQAIAETEQAVAYYNQQKAAGKTGSKTK
jgi:hypothetical protein